MPVRVYAEPTTEPVSLVEAKRHLRVDVDDDDADIAMKITAARRLCEKYVERSIATKTLEQVLDTFPDSGEIQLPFPPVQSVVQIAYDDSAGLSQILSPSLYQVDTANEPAWVILDANQTWPAVLDAFGSVRVRYVAGYVDPVPADLKAAILLVLGRLYGPRGDTSGDPVLDATVQALLQPYRLFW